MSHNVYSDDLKPKIVEFIQQGRTHKKVTELFGIHKSVVSRLLNRYKEKETVETFQSSEEN